MQRLPYINRILIYPVIGVNFEGQLSLTKVGVSRSELEVSCFFGRKDLGHVLQRNSSELYRGSVTTVCRLFAASSNIPSTACARNGSKRNHLWLSVK
jgi:hypothetical protein